MNETEFKQKYPKYSHLEGDALWNKMEDTLLDSDNALYADPNQVKTFHPPMETEYGKITIEDSSTTRWLDKDGKLVRVGQPFLGIILKTPTESYSGLIIDF